MSIIGFDLGTTNSLISFVRGARAINFTDEENFPTPSVVCYEGAKIIVGREAKGRLEQAGLGVHENIVRSPKLHLGKDGIFVQGVERHPVDIVSDVVRHVLEAAKISRRGKDLGSPTGAVVTIPVDMDGRARAALRDAFRKVGLPIVQFVHEPFAALYGYFRSANSSALQRQYERKLILVVDWGGGTLDLTLCRLIDGALVQIVNDGTPEVGGDKFDECIMNSLIMQVCESRGASGPMDTNPGARARLLTRCERAKIDLSSREVVRLFDANYFYAITDPSFVAELSRKDLDRLVTPLLDVAFRRIVALLERAECSAQQVALCLATGGMANMPGIRSRLHELFGPERLHIPEGTATLIAEGAAWIASDRTALRLAKRVELVMARGSFLPLLESGTSTPSEGTEVKETMHLYCTDPRDGHAKLQFCAPLRAGSKVLLNEPRRNLGHLVVPVDPLARAFHERLELDIRIDDNLIMHATARSLNVKGQGTCEMQDLEFGLPLPLTESPDEVSPTAAAIPDQGSEPVESGSLSVRSNISRDANLELVPGEFLFTYDPGYFDSRRQPPPHQLYEKLYYDPCARCGRPANHPECKCGVRRNV